MSTLLDKELKPKRTPKKRKKQITHYVNNDTARKTEKEKQRIAFIRRTAEWVNLSNLPS